MATITYREPATTDNAVDALERQLIAERHRNTMLQSQLQLGSGSSQSSSLASMLGQLTARAFSSKRNLGLAVAMAGGLLTVNVVIAAATAVIVTFLMK